MSIYGNMAGGNGAEKTFILVDEDGNESVGIVVDKETIFTATPNDIREGKIAGTEQGVTTGDKVIPSYNTSEGIKVVPPGSPLSFKLARVENYSYTKLQAIICVFNSSLSDSVSAEKVSINDKVYDVNSTIEISVVIKNDKDQMIDFGISNVGSVPYLIRYFTYKEIY